MAKEKQYLFLFLTLPSPSSLADSDHPALSLLSSFATALRLLRRSIISPPLLYRRNLSTSATASSQLDSNHNTSSSSAANHSVESANGDDAIFVNTRDKTSFTIVASSSLPLSPSSRLPSLQTSLRSRPKPAQKATRASDDSDSTPPPVVATCRNCGGPTCSLSSLIRSPPTTSSASAAASHSAKASDRIVRLFAIDFDRNKQEVVRLIGQILLRALANAGLIDPASHRLEEIDDCSPECELHIA